ncbi:MAG: glycosyltransferase 87 family protein [Ruminococcus sp.]|nr:glycosyltransferase 87 family protein [Ruminococcus sp.]
MKVRIVSAFLKTTAKEKLRCLYLGICSITAVCWFFSIMIHGKRSKQLDIFFAFFGDFFADFFNVVGYSAYGDPYHCTAYSGLHEKGYPPLCYVLMRPFSRLVDIGKYYKNDYFLDMRSEPALMMMLFVIVSALMILIFTLVRNKTSGSSLVKNLTAAVFTFSAPVVYTIERGNIILLTAVAVMFFLFYYDSENKVKREIALLSLGFAFGLKIAPAVFGCMLLFNKQYREAVRAAIYGLLFLFVPFLFIKGGFSNIPDMLSNMRLLTEYYKDFRGCTLRDCMSIILPYRASILFEGGFRFVIVLWLGLCSIFCKKKWERMTVFALIVMFVPFPSQYYGLLYLIPAAVMFMNEKELCRTDWLVMLCFFIIFLLNSNTSIPLNSVLQFGHTGALLMLTSVVLYRGTVSGLKFVMETADKRSKDSKLTESRFYKVISYSGGDLKKDQRRFFIILALFTAFLFLQSKNIQIMLLLLGIAVPLYCVLVFAIRKSVPGLARRFKTPELMQSYSYHFVSLLPLPEISTGKMKTGSLIRIVLLLMLLAVSIAASIIVKTNPNIPKEIGYRIALRDYEKGKYSKAEAIFEGLEEYKNSDEYEKKCEEAMLMK